jgi:hypothetical protein
MVVDDFRGGDLSVIPTEDQVPLLIDSHAAETFEIAGKGIEPVAWLYSQIREKIGCVKLAESQECSLLNFSGRLLQPTANPDLFGFVA